MPTRDATPIGAPNWVDLMTSDTDRAKAFYGELFGWEGASAGEDFGGYVTFSKDGLGVAGSMKNDHESGVPDVWSVYLAVENAEATVADAVAHGAQVIVPAMAVGDLGSMAVMVDPSGAAIGVWQAGVHTGFGVLAETGAPSWFELHTRDYDAAVAFYTDVFNWDAHDMSNEPDFRYTTLGEGPSAMAGIMDSSGFLPEGVPSSWQVYFGCDDTDATLQQVTALGGSVIEPAQDTPYGRLAVAADPMGAVFRLISPNLVGAADPG